MYLDVLKSLKKSSNLETRNEILTQVKFIEMLIYRMGNIYRATGPTGLYCISVFLISDVIYCITLFTKRRAFNYTGDNKFITFLVEPEDEKLKISKRIENLLKQLVYSNVNYTRLVFCTKERNSLVSSNKFASFNSELRGSEFSVRFPSLTHDIKKMKSVKDSHHIKRDICAIRIQQINSTDTLPDNDFRSSPKEILIESLSGQFKHLEALKLNKQTVWPVNRNDRWSRKIKQCWLQIYTGFHIIIWLITLTSSNISFYLSKKAIETYSGNFDVNFTKINIMDRLCIVDYTIYSLVVCHWFVTPLTVAIVCIRDQLEYLNSFEPRINRIHDKIKLLNNISEKSFNNQISSNTNIAGDFTQDSLRDLKFECDTEATDLYISYRLSEDEIKSSARLIQNAVGQGVSFTLLSTILPLAYFDSLPKDQYLFLSFVGTTLMISINSVLCLCAALHSSYRRMSKLIWSLIAFEESFAIDLIAKKKSTHIEHEQDKYGTNSFNRNRYSNDPNRGMTNLDFEYYLCSSMTPHTMFLWRRLVANYDILIGNSVGKLYGLFNIDFSGIVRFNFWFVSFIIISLSYKDR